MNGFKFCLFEIYCQPSTIVCLLSSSVDVFQYHKKTTDCHHYRRTSRKKYFIKYDMIVQKVQHPRARPVKAQLANKKKEGKQWWQPCRHFSRRAVKRKQIGSSRNQKIEKGSRRCEPLALKNVSFLESDFFFFKTETITFPTRALLLFAVDFDTTREREREKKRRKVVLNFRSKYCCIATHNVPRRRLRSGLWQPLAYRSRLTLVATKTTSYPIS